MCEIGYFWCKITLAHSLFVAHLYDTSGMTAGKHAERREFFCRNPRLSGTPQIRVKGVDVMVQVHNYADEEISSIQFNRFTYLSLGKKYSYSRSPVSFTPFASICPYAISLIFQYLYMDNHSVQLMLFNSIM